MLAVKCANCGEADSVEEIDLPGMKWGCMACGYWGDTEATTDNPPPDDDWNPTGQVHRREVD